MSPSLFRYHESVKLFGVIPLYDKKYEEDYVEREKVAVPQIPEQPPVSSTKSYNGQDFNDFWS